MLTRVKKSPFLSIAVKLSATAVIVAVFFAGAALREEILKKKRIQAEIEKLQEEAEKIGQENTTLGEKIAYLESREYQEREAKDKLNLQNPDESLVIIKPGVVRESRIESEKPSFVAPEMPEENSSSNSLKWWNYFFKY